MTGRRKVRDGADIVRDDRPPKKKTQKNVADVSSATEAGAKILASISSSDDKSKKVRPEPGVYQINQSVQINYKGRTLHTIFSIFI